MMRANDLLVTEAQGAHCYKGLIINADDWGRDGATTQSILDCITRGSVSSVSAMVFMEDSERSAKIAGEHNIDAGLHLNFTTPFSSGVATARLREHQARVTRYLRRTRWAPAIFNPNLLNSFECVTAAQLEEYERLYGVKTTRIDGHHHMHLCANVLMAKLLPPGTRVRRNFSFAPGEKTWGNRFYRSLVDLAIARRHSITDYFFSLPPINAKRIEHIFSLAEKFTVEVETHPVNPLEYEFLTEVLSMRLPSAKDAITNTRKYVS